MPATPAPSTSRNSLQAAYVGIILIWATTPLATKWSGDGPGPMFGVASRMCLGLLCVLLVCWVRRIRIPWTRRAWQHYAAGAIAFYGSMSISYWAAQQVPSGWMSVIFGLTPLLTAVLARVLLHENSLTPHKLAAQAVSLGGLWLIYGSAAQLGANAVRGVGALLLATLLHSFSSVLIKRINAHIPALASVAGTLVIAVPLYLLTWYLIDGKWPMRIPLHSVVGIVYLGVIATTLGLSWYFFVLKHLSATRVAMIQFATPVIALFLGCAVNHEPITTRIIAGTACILGGLLAHELSSRSFRAAAA